MFTPSHRRPYRMEREAREILNNMYFQGSNPDAYNAYREMQIKAQAQYINRLETAFMTAQAPNYRTAIPLVEAGAKSRVDRVGVWHRGMASMPFGAHPPVGERWALPRSPALIAQDQRRGEGRPVQVGTRERLLRDRAEAQRNEAQYVPYRNRPNIPPDLYTTINVTGLSPYGGEITRPISNMRQQQINRTRPDGPPVVERRILTDPRSVPRGAGAGAVDRGPGARMPDGIPAPARRPGEVSRKGGEESRKKIEGEARGKTGASGVRSTEIARKGTEEGVKKRGAESGTKLAETSLKNRSDLTKLNEELRSLQNERTKIAQERNKLQEDRTAANKRIQDLDTQIDRLRQEQEKARKDLEVARKTLGDAEEEVLKIIASGDPPEVRKKVADQIRKTMALTRAQMTVLETGQKTSQEELTRLQTMRKQLEAETKAVGSSLGALEKSIKSLEDRQDRVRKLLASRA